MKEHPIIFSSGVNAILQDRKTQTRRVARPQPLRGIQVCHWSPTGYAQEADGGGCTCQPIRVPYEPGDLLWVKEGWAAHRAYNAWRPSELVNESETSIWYRAGGERRGPGKKTSPDLRGKWRSPRFLPKWARRLWLEVLKVWPERVREIQGYDVMREGIGDGGVADDFAHDYHEFAELWDKLNAKRVAQLIQAGEITNAQANKYPYSWAANPWVWVIEFRRIERP